MRIWTCLEGLHLALFQVATVNPVCGYWSTGTQTMCMKVLVGFIYFISVNSFRNRLLVINILLKASHFHL